MVHKISRIYSKITNVRNAPQHLSHRSEAPAPKKKRRKMYEYQAYLFFYSQIVYILGI